MAKRPSERQLGPHHVLAEINFAQRFRSDAHLVRIYTRRLRARGWQDAQWLLRHGIVPVDPGFKSRH